MSNQNGSDWIGKAGEAQARAAKALRIREELTNVKMEIEWEGGNAKVLFKQHSPAPAGTSVKPARLSDEAKAALAKTFETQVGQAIQITIARTTGEEADAKAELRRILDPPAPVDESLNKALPAPPAAVTA